MRPFFIANSFLRGYNPFHLEFMFRLKSKDFDGVCANKKMKEKIMKLFLSVYIRLTYVARQ